MYVWRHRCCRIVKSYYSNYVCAIFGPQVTRVIEVVAHLGAHVEDWWRGNENVTANPYPEVNHSANDEPGQCTL